MIKLNFKQNRKVIWLSLSITAALLGATFFLQSESVKLKRIEPTIEILSEQKGDDSYDALLESVLSILDTYYVDQDRVLPEKVFEHTLRELEFQHLKFETTIDGQNAIVRIDGESTNLGTLPQTEDQLRSKLHTLITLINQNIKKFRSKDRDQDEGETLVVNALISSLDAHSSLMNAASYRDLRQGTEGSFGGLGILVGTRNHILTVVKPIPNSPASRIGVKENDKILSINTVDTFGISLDKLVEYMRGDPGTPVDLVLLREKEHAPRRVRLNREIIQVDSVTAVRYPHGTGSILHLSVDSFSSRTSKEALDAITETKKKGPIAGVILDLRSNPGGLLDQAVQLSDLFLKSGVIVSTKGRKEEVERAGRGYDELEYPVVILTNEESASASEIVAGALQDHKRAIVIGQRTFGKGSVQTVFELPYAQALKLTIARYYTPLNRSIQNRGIIPDIATQPIFKENQNLNLFGKSHYFNEFSLSHHLETEHNTFEGNSTFKKIFYAKSGSQKTLQEEDVELKLAKLVISKVHQQYGWTLPESARRASHWLGLTSSDVEKFAKIEGTKLKTWLQSSYKVDWDKETDSTANDITIDLSSSLDSSVEVVPGSSKTLSWTLSNKSQKQLARASVLMRSNDYQIETQEKLIGVMKQDQSINGTFELQVPRSIRPGKYEVNLTLAIDGEPLPETQKKVKLIVGERNFATVQMTAKFEDKSSGTLPQTLEPNEKCVIALSITNNSNVAIQKGKLKVFNFSGAQIKLPEHDIEVQRFDPGQSIQVEIPAVAGSKLYANRHQIGIMIESDDLAEASYALAVIGEGNTDIPSKSLAH